MVATWSAKIVLTSSLHGLAIHIAPSKIVPEIRHTRTEGTIGLSTHERAFKLLKAQLPGAIDFKLVVDELKHNLEGAWMNLHVDLRELMVGHPVFNRKGDLLLDLGVRALPGYMPPKPVITTGLSASANGHANGHHHANGAAAIGQTIFTSDAQKQGFFDKGSSFPKSFIN